MDHGILFDHARTARIGLPEAVFCEGKPFEALVELLSSFGRGSGHPVLFTRLAPDVFARVPAEIRAEYDYHPLSRTAFGDALPPKGKGRVAVISAGTADGFVAWEAARTLAYLGIGHKLFEDCGVAGLWRRGAAGGDQYLRCRDRGCRARRRAGQRDGRAYAQADLRRADVRWVRCGAGRTGRAGEYAFKLRSRRGDHEYRQRIRRGLRRRKGGKRIMSEAHAHGDHAHRHEHHHEHGHTHETAHGDGRDRAGRGRILTIRSHSGLSGDMFLAGLLRMTELDEAETDRLLASVLPELAGAVRLTRRQVNRIGGWFADVSLPHQHEHRTLEDILGIIAGSGMDDEPKRLASDTFTLLAKAEAAVHGMKPEAVRFHEVGALDSILDICMACVLFTRLSPARFVVSPLPIADGEVVCAHGVIPVPAPAVLELLEGIPVRPFSGEGETVTPTAIALLRSLGATFGPWPAMLVEKRALVYGSRVFANAPNGTIFACGTELEG